MISNHNKDNCYGLRTHQLSSLYGVAQTKTAARWPAPWKSIIAYVMTRWTAIRYRENSMNHFVRASSECHLVSPNCSVPLKPEHPATDSPANYSAGQIHPHQTRSVFSNHNTGQWRCTTVTTPWNPADQHHWIFITSNAGDFSRLELLIFQSIPVPLHYRSLARYKAYTILACHFLFSLIRLYNSSVTNQAYEHPYLDSGCLWNSAYSLYIPTYKACMYVHIRKL